MTANVLVSTGNLPYEDWLEYRKAGIGGSDAAVVCGISRYKSPVELWMEKTGQLPSQEAGRRPIGGTCWNLWCGRNLPSARESR